MRSKTPSLAKMKRICAWKFVRSSYIGGDIRDQNYLENTVSLNKMTYYKLLVFCNNSGLSVSFRKGDEGFSSSQKNAEVSFLA